MTGRDALRNCGRVSADRGAALRPGPAAVDPAGERREKELEREEIGMSPGSSTRWTHGVSLVFTARAEYG